MVTEDREAQIVDLRSVRIGRLSDALEPTLEAGHVVASTSNVDSVPEWRQAARNACGGSYNAGASGFLPVMADSDGLASGTEYMPLLRDDGSPGLSSSDLERLRRALIARYGPDLGNEAYAEAAAHAAVDLGRVAAMANPVGYLYRVGQSRLRWYLRWRRQTVSFERASPKQVEAVSWFEPALPKALAALSERQRVCLILILAEQWTYAEVADLLEISRASVQTHVDRAKASIRAELGVDDDK